MPKPNVREQLIEAGTAVFHRAGFHGCSVEDITRAAGVPKGSFYNHFESKEDLAVEALSRYVESTPQGVLSNASVPPVKRLKRYFELLAADFVASKYQRGCLVGNLSAELADHSPKVQAKLGALFVSWTKSLAEVVKQGQASGEIQSTLEAATLAGFLLSAWEGTLLRVRATRDERLLKQFQRAAFDSLVK